MCVTLFCRVAEMDARKILQNKNLTVTRIPASNDVEVEEVQPDIGQLASTGDLQTVSLRRVVRIKSPVVNEENR